MFSAKVRFGFLVLAAFFGFIAMLIVFNTIRVAIYVHRDEIGIMKLVGATDWIIRGRFCLKRFVRLHRDRDDACDVRFPQRCNPYILQFFTGVDVDLIGYFSNALLIFGGQFVGLRSSVSQPPPDAEIFEFDHFADTFVWYLFANVGGSYK